MFPQSTDGYWQYDGPWPIVGGRSENVIHGFEDDTLSNYGGDTDEFTVQSDSVLRGYYSARGESGLNVIGDDGSDYPTPRTSDPTEYRGRLFMVNGGEAKFLTSVQSESSPHDECYGIAVDASDDEIRLYKQVNGSSVYFEETNHTIEANREYWPFITLDETGINGGVYDSSGDELYRTASYEDTDYDGGGIGWRTGPSYDSIFDHAAYYPGEMDELVSVTIDGFEDGNLSEYSTPSSSGSKGTSPSAALRGTYGLELDGFGYVISKPGMGLDNYPEGDVEFEVHFNPRVGGTQQYWVLLCPQNTGTRDEAYNLEFLMDGLMRIRKDNGSTAYTLEGSGSSESDFAETQEVSWNTDNWYRADITLSRSTPYIRAALYDHSSNSYIAYVEQDEDREFINSGENGIGFYSSGSGRVYYDEIEEK